MHAAATCQKRALCTFLSIEMPKLQMCVINYLSFRAEGLISTVYLFTEPAAFD
jgi:hypothetical protein